MTFARLGRNATWLLVGRVVSAGLLVLATVLLAARLGPHGLGEYAFVAAVVFLAGVATTFGTDMVIIREVAAGGSPDTWAAALAVQLGLSAGAVVLAWLAAPLIPGQSPEAVSALRIFILALGPAALFSVATAALRGTGRMARQAFVGIATALLQLLAVWALVAPGATTPTAVVVLVGVQVAAGVVAWAACASCMSTFRRLPRTTAADVARVARASAPIGLLGLVGVLYQRAGVIALGVLVGPVATGWFAAASRVVETSKTGHVALFGALYPALAEAHAAGERTPATARALARTARLSATGGVLLSAGLVLFSPVIVRVLYGPAFAPSTGAVAVLALSLLPSTIATYISLELLATHREALTLRALALSLTVLVVLLAALVPLLGWIGACWAVAGAETVQALAMATARGWGRGAARPRLLARPSPTPAVEVVR